MLNLFQHLCHLVKIPIFIGMIFFCHAELDSASLQKGKDSDMHRNDEALSC